MPHVAVFDTAFHVRMPRRARTYAIEPGVAELHGLRRFGFRGTSHRFPVFDISASSARVRALVIATNEELQIARETVAVVRELKRVRQAKPIPIAISARHVHLDRAGMDALFGPGSELTPYEPLSQPGHRRASCVSTTTTTTDPSGSPSPASRRARGDGARLRGCASAVTLLARRLR